MFTQAQLDTITEVLELALSDENFIDTTSGGACSPTEAEELREQMRDAQAAAIRASQKPITGDFQSHGDVTLSAEYYDEGLTLLNVSLNSTSIPVEMTDDNARRLARQLAPTLTLSPLSARLAIEALRRQVNDLPAGEGTLTLRENLKTTIEQIKAQTRF